MSPCAREEWTFAYRRCSTDVLLCTAVAVGLLLLGLSTSRNRNSCSVLTGWGFASASLPGCKLEPALQQPGE